MLSNCHLRQPGFLLPTISVLLWNLKLALTSLPLPLRRPVKHVHGFGPTFTTKKHHIANEIRKVTANVLFENSHHVGKKLIYPTGIAAALLVSIIPLIVPNVWPHYHLWY